MTVAVYSQRRSLQVVAYEALGPRVVGLRPIQSVVVRDPTGRREDCYLFTTDGQARVAWVVTQFAWRWAIEVLFRASNQVLEIEAPPQRSRASGEKVAPWVGALRSVVMGWYLTAGPALPEAAKRRDRLGDGGTEWSLAQMLRVLRRATLNDTIKPNSATPAELTAMGETLKNWANLAA